MALSVNKVFTPGLAPGAVGAYFGAQQSTSVSASGRYVLPAGLYIVSAIAGLKLQYSTDGGTTWVDITPAGTGGFVVSDGTNVGIFNTNVSATNATYINVT